MVQRNTFIGKQFGSYCIKREIARGGFGTVYQAQHLILTDRVVAIKILHDVHLGTQQELEEFLKEAQILEKLKYPFILPVLDVGIQENVPFIITQYAPHGSLRDRMQSRKTHLLAVEEILTLLSQVGQALQFAHQHHIIHRDMKPENILFNAEGDALLADFGIAVILSTASIRYTSVTGTPAYMAPEQFQGNVSRQTDQYALGCIAYELFTGQKPFTAPDFIAMGFKHATEMPIPPRQLNHLLPVPIEAAILKSMAKIREDRYTDVITFINALQIISKNKEQRPYVIGYQTEYAPVVSRSTGQDHFISSSLGFSHDNKRAMAIYAGSLTYQLILFGLLFSIGFSNTSIGGDPIKVLAVLPPGLIYLVSLFGIISALRLIGKKNRFTHFRYSHITWWSHRPPPSEVAHEVF